MKTITVLENHLLKENHSQEGNQVYQRKRPFGAGAHLNQGFTIGDNAVIGSGSVVSKYIPSNVIAAGVPYKVIREITEEDKTGYKP